MFSFSFSLSPSFQTPNMGILRPWILSHNPLLLFVMFKMFTHVYHRFTSRFFCSVSLAFNPIQYFFFIFHFRYYIFPFWVWSIILHERLERGFPCRSLELPLCVAFTSLVFCPENSVLVSLNSELCFFNSTRWQASFGLSLAVV